MKANAPKRKIFDAVDMLTEDTSARVQGEAEKGVQMLPVDQIEPYHKHPFHLYEGERLDDMVESIRNHGVLCPVIVQKKGKGYEMLSGHNRQNAAKLAGLVEIPAIVKTELTEEEAYVYVIETNVLQRSFSKMISAERWSRSHRHRPLLRSAPSSRSPGSPPNLPVSPRSDGYARTASHTPCLFSAQSPDTVLRGFGYSPPYHPDARLHTGGTDAYGKARSDPPAASEHPFPPLPGHAPKYPQSAYPQHQISFFSVH